MTLKTNGYRLFGSFLVAIPIARSLETSHLSTPSPEGKPLNPYITNHITKQCAILGLSTIPKTVIESSRRGPSSLSAYCVENLQGSRITIVRSEFFFPDNSLFYDIRNTNSNTRTSDSFRNFSGMSGASKTSKSDKENIKGIINHELGHLYHHHSLQRDSCTFITGILCFFVKTRFQAFIFAAIYPAIRAPWARFREQQADAICGEISTPSELKGVIRSLGPYPKSPKSTDVVSKVIDFFNDSHPPCQDRIEYFEEILKKKEEEEISRKIQPEQSLP